MAQGEWWMGTTHVQPSGGLAKTIFCYEFQLILGVLHVVQLDEMNGVNVFLCFTKGI